jgi:hypothetical protein
MNNINNGIIKYAIDFSGYRSNFIDNIARKKREEMASSK